MDVFFLRNADCLYFLVSCKCEPLHYGSGIPGVPPLLSSSARGLSIARLLWSFLCPRAALEGEGEAACVEPSFKKRPLGKA